MTIATVLLVLTNVSAHVVPMSSPAPTHDAETAHRIAYVRPAATPPVVRSESAPVRPHVSPRPRPSAPVREQLATPDPPPPAATDSSAGAPPSPNAKRSAVAAFEQRWTAHGVSPLLLPSTPSGPAYAGSAPSPGATVRVPPASVDHDAQLRAQDMADRAARAAGTPVMPHGGMSIDAPIPFGGPSNAQRKRDSIVNAQTKAVLVRVRQRLDSIAAARRRHADSLAALEKHP